MLLWKPLNTDIVTQQARNDNFIWRSVLLVEETGVHGENHQPVASH